MAKQAERDYSATPLAKKLGLMPAQGKALEVAVLSAPQDLMELLGELPANITLRQKLDASVSLALVFVRTLAEMHAAVDLLRSYLPKTASAWIIRPKTHLKPGFNENDVRDAGLAVGLVDYKICSVSEQWSGIKFAWRKTAA